ncbi:hypothetical protein F5884DRAFT_748658 [Xylogone sp. PMI_703]|nr:hypothetical protein F5884DRAFT_748658 [Xylogone sp. PMI_703]
MGSSIHPQTPQSLEKPGKKWQPWKFLSRVIHFDRGSSVDVVDQASDYTSDSESASLNPYARWGTIEGANGHRKPVLVLFDTQSDANLVSAEVVHGLEPLNLPGIPLPPGHAHEYSSPLSGGQPIHPTHYIKPRLILPEIGFDQRPQLRIVDSGQGFGIILGFNFIKQYKKDHGVSLIDLLDGSGPGVSCRGTVAVLIRDKKKSMSHFLPVPFRVYINLDDVEPDPNREKQHAMNMAADRASVLSLSENQPASGSTQSRSVTSFSSASRTQTFSTQYTEDSVFDGRSDVYTVTSWDTTSSESSSKGRC